MANVAKRNNMSVIHSVKNLLGLHNIEGGPIVTVHFLCIIVIR